MGDTTCRGMEFRRVERRDVRTGRRGRTSQEAFDSNGEVDHFAGLPGLSSAIETNGACGGCGPGGGT